MGYAQWTVKHSVSGTASQYHARTDAAAAHSYTPLNMLDVALMCCSQRQEIVMSVQGRTLRAIQDIGGYAARCSSEPRRYLGIAGISQPTERLIGS